MRAPITDKQLLEMMWDRFPEIMKRGTEPAQPSKPLTQCWKCGDMDSEFQAKCNVPACGMKEQP